MGKTDNELNFDGYECVHVSRYLDNNTYCKRNHGGICLFYKSFLKISVIETENKGDICERLLTEYVCGIALNELQNNKSQGSDGKTIEFYKLFD